MPKEVWAFDGRYNARMAAFFVENRIFLSHPFGVRSAYAQDARLQIAEGVQVERYATLPPRHFVSMGAYSYCISGKMPASTRIGRYCSIATNVRVMGVSYPLNRVTTQAYPMAPFAPLDETAPSEPTPRVTIGDDVWIGQDVMIAPGVSIGTGAIVAAGSVVVEDVAPYAIVGGVEARFIRDRFPQPLIERMLASQWWRYNYADFGDLPMDQPDAFLEGLARRVEAGEIQPFEPGVLDLGPALTAWMAAEA
jgi:virginiamycin A acetyltransferase